MSEIKYAPILLFVYNRPDHTRKTLEKLNQLPEVKTSKLYIFSDNAKNEKATAAVEQVRRIVDEYAEKSNFAQVEVRKASENRGLAASIIGGVTEIIREYGRVIVLEDDLEVAPDFLTYMNGALDFYRDKEKIWAVSGYTFPMKSLDSYPHDIYMCGRGCSWGWATWSDRWETVDWDVSDYPKFKFNLSRRRAFARWGKDLPTMLDAYMYGEIHSWAIRWCYEAFKQGKLTVYPVRSRIANHGTDGSGTNFSHAESRYDTVISNDSSEVRFEMLGESKKIRTEFSRRYATPMENFKRDLRWLLIRAGVLRAQS